MSKKNFCRQRLAEWNFSNIWLGFSRENFEFAKHEKNQKDEFQSLISINQYDTNVDPEAFYLLVNEYANVDIYSIGVIVDYFGISLQRIIEYLNSVNFDQSCECEKAIIQWRDYLRRYETFYMRIPKTDEEKFPDSLKRLTMSSQSSYIKSVWNNECLNLFLRRKECGDRIFLTWNMTYTVMSGR